MKNRVPKLSFHRASGNYFIKLNGKTIYLGKDRTAAENARILKLAEIVKNSSLPQLVKSGMTPNVNQVVVAYLESLTGAKRKRYDLLSVCRWLVSNYGALPITQFRKRHFKELKIFLSESGLAFSTVKARTQYAKQVFEYACEEEIIDAAQLLEIRMVKPFKRNEASFPETQPVRPVSTETVEKTLPYLPPAVADMVLVQLYAGMRAGELCSMTAGDIDRTGTVWIYTPKHHKTEHHGKRRTVYLGLRAQAILEKYITEDEDSPLFSPQQSEAVRKQKRRAARVSSIQPSQRDRRKRNAKRKPGRAYNKDSYGRAIARGCQKAIEAGALQPGEAWHNHQLRHTAATEARKVAGLDGAQVFLGHSSANVTQIYAERDDTLGVKIAELIG